MTHTPVIIGERSLVCVVDGRHFSIDATHLHYGPIRDVLRDVMKLDATGEDTSEKLVTLRLMLDIPSFVAQLTEGRVQVGGGKVMFDGVEQHGYVPVRIVKMLSEGFDVRAMMRFLDRLQKNPIQHVRDGLLNWLEKGGMPLTPDGCFIAYKYVSDDYMDNYTRKINNSIGAKIERLDINRVDTSPHITCAGSGYHFCSYGYMRDAESHTHVMLLKIAPEDVASFPLSEEAKGRCVWYEVIDEVPQDQKVKDVDKRPIEHSSVAVAVGTYDSGEAPSTRARIAKAVVTDKPTVDETRARLKASKGAGVGQWTIGALRKLVKKVGQRTAAAQTGIPRSTLQDRLRKS